MVLTQQEQLRYSRQIMLDKIGEQGQIALRNAKVLIVGSKISAELPPS